MGVYDDDRQKRGKGDIYDVEFVRAGTLSQKFNTVTVCSAVAASLGALALVPMTMDGGLGFGMLDVLGVIGLMGAPFMSAALAVPAGMAVFNKDRPGLSRMFSGVAAAAGGVGASVLLSGDAANVLRMGIMTTGALIVAGICNIAAEATKNTDWTVRGAGEPRL